jgi:branched-chain amino acid transport system ATP-binding protein
MALLEVERIDVRYGDVAALHSACLQVADGEIVCVVGPNGAGKSTLMRTISGMIHPVAGSIRYDGRELTRLPPREIVRLGISHAPEGRQIFAGLSVAENLEVATAPWRRRRENVDRELEYVYEIFPHLRARRRQMGWSMSGGEQQMLAIGRALMARPRLLLLDEPSLGLGPKIVREVFTRIREINKRGTAVLLVEQNAKMAVELADRGYLLEFGNVVLEGRRSDLAQDTRVKAAYLGG